ncbi:MAG: VWA domain-containing protein [Haliscomenobacteraceae bacterium CHB4]|nr:VWA domain-containing protein [Haliscomenobacteraceae bacterium CHB4]
MTFAQPYWLLLLLLLPVLMYGYRRTANNRHVALQVSRQAAMRGVKTWVVYARKWIQALRWLVLALLIVAMARPQKRWYEEKIEAEALDIMLVMDISPSMLTKDFKPDRLTVAKQMANDFASRRQYDRIGLVVFSGGAFTQCPLTNDRRILQAFINNLQVGRLKDGTAIGMGIATAVNHLKDSEAKSKVAIVLTDSEQNAGEVGPVKAAAIAKALGVKVYTIGLGTEGTVMSPTYQNFDGSFDFAARTMTFDTKLLEEVARLSGGQFYRARTSDDLKGIYTEIDRLEKTKITSAAVRRTLDYFFWLLDAAFCLLVLEMLLRWGPLRVVTS